MESEQGCHDLDYPSISVYLYFIGGMTKLLSAELSFGLLNSSTARSLVSAPRVLQERFLGGHFATLN
jgi:hypothetical protein